MEEVEEDDDVDGVNEVDTILEEISGSSSNVPENAESIEKLDEVEAADLVVNRLGPERVVDLVKVELELDVLTSSNMVLGTSEKVAELVWKADEFVTAEGSVEIDLKVDEVDADVNDEIFDCVKDLISTEAEETLSIVGANASAVGLPAVALREKVV